MNDRISMGSVSEKLLNFINTAQVHDSYYDIALTLVKNSEKVKHMSIAEMADLCYVSQATISRFCRFLGYWGGGSAGKAKAARRPPCGLCGDAILHGYVCVSLHQVNPRWMIHSCAFAHNYTKKLLRLKDTFYQFFYQFFWSRHRAESSPWRFRRR